MDSVIRGAVIYGFLWMIFRISGKRSLAQINTFDFILLLIIAETTQQALLAEDFSITNALLLIVTLLGLDVALSVLKQKSKIIDKIVDGIPLVIVEDGRPLEDRMRKARVDASDVLTAARTIHGLERMDQIKYAVLERSGGISVIPKPEASRGA